MRPFVKSLDFTNILRGINKFAEDIDESEGSECSKWFPAVRAKIENGRTILEFGFCINEGISWHSSSNLDSKWDPQNEQTFPYNVEIVQKYSCIDCKTNPSNKELRFQVSINGSMVIDILNRYPRVFQNLDIFAGSESMANAVGNIENFVITSEQCFSKQEVFKSSTKFWESPTEYAFIGDALSGQMYYNVFDQANVSIAKATCKTDHVKTKFPIFLPGPRNVNENNQLRFIMEDNKINGEQLKEIWLGVQRSTNNIEDWIHYSNLNHKHEYFNWDVNENKIPKEPNNAGKPLEKNVIEKNVMATLPDNDAELYWNDINPEEQYPFICLAIIRGLYFVI